MARLKASAFKTLTFLFKHSVGTGLGKIPFTKTFYDYLYRKLVVNELILNVHGSKMITRVSNDDGISYQLLFYRSGLEKYETQLFKKLVKKGMTVVDIGANIGYYALLAARSVGDKGRVFAFEPEPNNYNLLERNIALNRYSNIVAVQKAVSNKTGKAPLFVNRQTGAHGLLPGRKDIVGTNMVDIVSLDKYFKGKENPIDIIKIDVEGAELAVLRGMPNILRNNDNLIIFTEIFWSGSIQKSRLYSKQYWDKLIKFGFKYIYLVNEDMQRIEIIDYASLLSYCKYISKNKRLSPNLLCAKYPIKNIT